MPVECPECGGDMLYDPKTRLYNCFSCGLSLSRTDLIEIREKSRWELTPEERKRKEVSEYLKWWYSSKKEKKAT